MFKRKTRAGEYAQVKMEHEEVSVSDNFEVYLIVKIEIRKEK